MKGREQAVSMLLFAHLKFLSLDKLEEFEVSEGKVTVREDSF